MLIRLIPDQVEKAWELVAPAIMKSLPPTIVGTRKGMINILEAILLEKLTVWIITDEGQEEVLGILTTKIRYEEVSKTRDLLIYSFTAFNTTEGDSVKYWRKCYETLKKYALSKNCYNILAYSSNPRIIKFLKQQGANTDNVLIRLEV